MGERYKAKLEEKIGELGGKNLRVFINQDGVDPRYYQHLQETFKEAGVRFVERREEANFVFDGHSEPVYHYGQVTAYFENDLLSFAGAL